MNVNRLEFKLALLFFVIGINVSRLFESNFVCFVSGMFYGLGFLALILCLLSDKHYNNLMYKKLLGKTCV